MAVLSTIVGALGTAYLVPRLSGFAWRNAFTWFGKTFATWAIVAYLWDLISNNGDGRDFSNMDFAISALIAGGIRVVV